MGKRGKEGIRRGDNSHNYRNNSNKTEKRIEKQRPFKITSLVVPNSTSASIVSGDKFPPCHGYIFMCNGKTKTDCFKYRVFGLPAARMDVLEKINPEMSLFLFDFDLRLLYGIFLPASRGEMSIEPTAFGGRFSAQVRFQIYKDCLPLPENVFKPIIRDNYQGSKFRQEMSKEHVENLISLFRPVDMSPLRGVEPPGFGEYSRPASLDQDLSRPHFVQERPPQYSQHNIRQYYSDEAHQGYFPASPEEELYNRYAADPRDNQVRLINRTSITPKTHNNFPSESSKKSLSAAYWISVANESLEKENNYISSHQNTPSTTTQTPPIVEEREAPPPEVAAQPPAEDGPPHLTPVTYQDPNHMYSNPSQWQPTYPVPETGANLHFPSTDNTFNNNYYNHNTLSVDPNGVPVHTHDSRAYHLGTSGIPAQASDPAAYYSETTNIQGQGNEPTTAVYNYYYDYIGNSIPTQAHEVAACYYDNNGNPIPAQPHEVASYHSANIPGQVHDPAAAAYYYPENSYVHTNSYVPSSSQAPAYWDPNQVGGVTHFPQTIIPSRNNCNSVGGGEYLTLSLPGAAAPTVVPVVNSSL